MKFNRYKIIVTIQNSNAKYWEYSSCSLKAETIPSKVLSSGSSDDKFYNNNRLQWIDHFCIEDNCSDFPRYNNIAAPHQVICPNGTQKCEKEFLYPTSLAGEPNISWWGWIFTEMKGEVKQNTATTPVKTTIKTNPPIKSIKTNTLVNETKLFDKSKTAFQFFMELRSKFITAGYTYKQHVVGENFEITCVFEEFEFHFLTNKNEAGKYYANSLFYHIKNKNTCNLLDKYYVSNSNNYTKEVKCIDADPNDIHSFGTIRLIMK